MSRNRAVRRRAGAAAVPAVRRRGALLLEVVVALAILVTALGFLGAQLAGGLEMTAFAEAQLRGSLLADRILAMVQLDPNMQRVMSELGDEFDLEDEFGDADPGYFWRVHCEPVERELPAIKVISIEVLYQTDTEHRDHIEGAKVVRHFGFLKAEPAKIDLASDAGLSDDMIEQLRQSIPIAGFDPHAVDLQQLMSLLDPELLEQIMPMLSPLLAQLAAGGMPAELSGLLAQLQGGGLEELGQLAGGGAGGPSTEDLANRIRQAAGGKPGGAPGGATPAGGGARAPRGQKPPGGAPPMGQTPPAKPPVEVVGGDEPPVQAPPPRPGSSGGPRELGQGTGPNGEFTIEDLMRMRDQWQQTKGGQ